MITGTYNKAAGLLEIGVHPVTIVDANETVASTGTPQLHVVVQSAAGKTGHAYLALTEKAAFGVCQLLEAVDMAPKEGEAYNFEATDLIDKKCWVRVKQNGNGQLRTGNFSATAPSAQANVAPVSDEETT